MINSKAPCITIVMGLKGSGVSSALYGLSQHGWVTLDNVSPSSLSDLQWLSHLSPNNQPVALGLSQPPQDTLFYQLKQSHPGLTTIFLTARPEILAGRTAAYVPDSQPVADNLATPPGQDYVLDTSTLRVDELWAKLRHLLEGADTAAPLLTLVLQSFAFKRGVPADADWVLDVRFLHNPFYDPVLKPLTGLQREVQDYVLAQPQTRVFFESLTGLLIPTLPQYQQQGRARLTVAIGCTGGRHRSVTLVERLAGFVQEQNLPYPVIKHHRDASYW